MVFGGGGVWVLNSKNMTKHDKAKSQQRTEALFPSILRVNLSNCQLFSPAKLAQVNGESNWQREQRIQLQQGVWITLRD